MKKENDKEFEDMIDVALSPAKAMKDSWRKLKLLHKIAVVILFVTVWLFICYQDDVAQKQYNYLNTVYTLYDEGSIDKAVTYLDQYLEGGNKIYWLMQQMADKHYNRSYETVTMLRDDWVESIQESDK